VRQIDERRGLEQRRARRINLALIKPYLLVPTEHDLGIGEKDLRPLDLHLAAQVAVADPRRDNPLVPGILFDRDPSLWRVAAAQRPSRPIGDAASDIDDPAAGVAMAKAVEICNGNLVCRSVYRKEVVGRRHVLRGTVRRPPVRVVAARIDDGNRVAVIVEPVAQVRDARRLRPCEIVKGRVKHRVRIPDPRVSAEVAPQRIMVRE
jgi:hypothetical protein